MSITDELSKIQEAVTFTELNSIFEEWVRDGKSEEYKDLFLTGYTSLISYPAIILTKELAIKEVQAANVAYEYVMKYGKDSIKNMIESDDKKMQFVGKLSLLPPSKRLLAGCNAFYMLDYLIMAETHGKDKSEIDGNDYAKQWNFLLCGGYKGEMTEKAIMDDHDHRVMSMRAIQEMALNEESKQVFSDEYYGQKMKQYINNGNSGSGCIVLILVAGAMGLLASCI